MNAFAWLRRTRLAGVIFLVFMPFAFVASFGASQWSRFAWVGLGAAFIWFSACGITRVYASQWEFARGYTTLKSFANQYEYRDPKSTARGAFPMLEVAHPNPVVILPVAEEATVGSSVASAEVWPSGQLASVVSDETATLQNQVPSSWRRRRRVFVSLFLSLCVLLVGTARMVVSVFQQPGQLWLYALLVLSSFVVIIGCVLGLPALSGQRALWRVGKVDADSDLYVAGPSPELIRAITRTWPDSVVPARLVLGVDGAGLRLWNPRSMNRPIVSVPWTSVVSLGIGQATVPMSSNAKRPTIDILTHTSAGDLRLPVFIRRPMFPGISMRIGYVTSAAALITAHRA